MSDQAVRRDSTLANISNLIGNNQKEGALEPQPPVTSLAIVTDSAKSVEKAMQPGSAKESSPPVLTAATLPTPNAPVQAPQVPAQPDAQTIRRNALAAAAVANLPSAPAVVIDAIVDMACEKGFEGVTAPVAVWLTGVAIIRHRCTDYDALLAQYNEQGMPSRKARAKARDESAPDINVKLMEWGSKKFLETESETEDPRLPRSASARSSAISSDIARVAPNKDTQEAVVLTRQSLESCLGAEFFDLLGTGEVERLIQELGAGLQSIDGMIAHCNDALLLLDRGKDAEIEPEKDRLEALADQCRKTIDRAEQVLRTGVPLDLPAKESPPQQPVAVSVPQQLLPPSGSLLPGHFALPQTDRETINILAARFARNLMIGRPAQTPVATATVTSNAAPTATAPATNTAGTVTKATGAPRKPDDRSGPQLDVRQNDNKKGRDEKTGGATTSAPGADQGKNVGNVNKRGGRGRGRGKGGRGKGGKGGSGAAAQSNRLVFTPSEPKNPKPLTALKPKPSETPSYPDPETTPSMQERRPTKAKQPERKLTKAEEGRRYAENLKREREAYNAAVEARRAARKAAIQPTPQTPSPVAHLVFKIESRFPVVQPMGPSPELLAGLKKAVGNVDEIYSFLQKFFRITQDFREVRQKIDTLPAYMREIVGALETPSNIYFPLEHIDFELSGISREEISEIASDFLVTMFMSLQRLKLFILTLSETAIPSEMPQQLLDDRDQLFETAWLVFRCIIEAHRKQ